MQKIGEGYFYNVFDIGNQRVFKKGKKFIDIAKNVRGNSKNFFVQTFVKASWHFFSCFHATKKIQKKVTKYPNLLGVFGNPNFLSCVNYEQDKITPLMDYFASHNEDENKIMVDKYVSLIETLLEYGIHDYVYKFKNSYGINKEGNLIMVDFNEVTFSKSRTIQFVIENQWENEAQFRKYENGNLKEYIGEKLRKSLTVENVNMLWGQKT
jgi:hypothetical protein